MAEESRPWGLNVPTTGGDLREAVAQQGWSYVLKNQRGAEEVQRVEGERAAGRASEK